MNAIRITAAAVLSVVAIGAHAASADNANRQLSYGELGYPVQAVSGVSPSRAQIVADFEQTRAQGLISTGELGSAPVVLEKSGSTITRAQVRAELAQAKANGELLSGELDHRSTRI